MDIARLLIPPVFGAVIGLVTNALAIRMLFRPYREVRVLGLRFQGTIPRRKADIARTVSQVVTSELLREEQVAKRLAGPEVRGALRELALALAERYRGVCMVLWPTSWGRSGRRGWSVSWSTYWQTGPAWRSAGWPPPRGVTPWLAWWSVCWT